MSQKQAHGSCQTSTSWKAPNGDCKACLDHTFMIKVLDGNIDTLPASSVLMKVPQVVPYP